MVAVSNGTVSDPRPPGKDPGLVQCLLHIRGDSSRQWDATGLEISRMRKGRTEAGTRHGGLPEDLRLSEVLAGLTAALDITEGQPVGHSVRSCMIGMRIAERIGMAEDERADLLYALLLKDLGCSSNAAKMCYLFGTDDRKAKRNLKLARWTTMLGGALYSARQVLPDGTPWARMRKFIGLGLEGSGAAQQLVAIRCERGADLADMLGLSHRVREAIRGLDEHWNGDGHPRGLRHHEISLESRIMGLAQTVEVFFTASGGDDAMSMARERSGSWLDPELVGALDSIHADGGFWAELAGESLLDRVLALEPADRVVTATDESLDAAARVFSWVIDAKSPWTLLHSENVARIAGGMARELGMSEEEQRDIRRAGLLHDIGKLGVSNLILDKPSKLDAAEWAALRDHPAYTRWILQRVRHFSKFAESAAAHHERLDGKGYDLGLGADQLGRLERILTLADRYEAMSAYRPYRAETPIGEVLRVLADDRGSGVCPEAFEALKCHLAGENAFAPQSLASARHRGEADRSAWLDATRAVRPPTPSLAATS